MYQVSAEQLEGRTARCTCGHSRPSTDSLSLAFFEYRGPGSESATDVCKNCAYHRVAHTPEKRTNNRLICGNFQADPQGREYDLFYCGHGGWD